MTEKKIESKESNCGRLTGRQRQRQRDTRSLHSFLKENVEETLPKPVESWVTTSERYID